VITLVVSISVFAFGYGALSQDVEQLRVAVSSIQNRGITPEAAVRITALESGARGVERETGQLRSDIERQRAEMNARFDRLETMIDNLRASRR
jgi:hypothetical protein